MSMVNLFTKKTLYKWFYVNTTIIKIRVRPRGEYDCRNKKNISKGYNKSINNICTFNYTIISEVVKLTTDNK